MKLKLVVLLSLGLALCEMPGASAALLNSYQFNGKGNWSIDGVGSNNTPVGNINSIVPVGSNIEKAFLYSTTYNFGNPFTPTVNFDGTVYTGANWTDLGFAATCCGLKAFRTDVTSQVAAKIGGGSASPFTFTVESEDPNDSIDGEVLAIVYSNPTEKERTIAFLDGSTAASGTTTNVNLANPLTSAQLSDPSFEALMSLGIGFSTGDPQYSQVDVNGQRLTTSAGGFDEGGLFNGGLVTVGGLGDNPANPANPLSASSPDDELYTLNPFLNAGDTTIKIDSLNPSNDDNIFFLGLNLTAKAGVDQPPPTDTKKTPEPASLLGLLAVGAFGATSTLNRKKSS